MQAMKRTIYYPFILLYGLVLLLFVSIENDKKKVGVAMNLVSAETGPDRAVLFLALSEDKGKVDSFL
jgi:hypothetical protein